MYATLIGHIGKITSSFFRILYPMKYADFGMNSIAIKHLKVTY